MAEKQEPSSVFTSLRYDEICLKAGGLSSPFYHSEFHRERLLHAALYFNWVKASKIPILNSQDIWEQTLYGKTRSYFMSEDGHVKDTVPLKIRIDIGKDGSVTWNIAPIPSTPLSILYPSILEAPQNVDLSSVYCAVLDWIPTQINPFTCFKTANRTDYDGARQRMTEVTSKFDSRGTILSEIILYNPEGAITEGSVTNVYFWRNKQWVTPPVGPKTGGLDGVARRWAIETGLCSQVERVNVKDVKEGEIIWISNGVRGFNPGKIVVRNGLE